MIGNRSAYRGEDYRLVQGRWHYNAKTLGAGLRGKPYGEKIMRGGDDNTEKRADARTPPPPRLA